MRSHDMFNHMPARIVLAGLLGFGASALAATIGNRPTGPNQDTHPGADAAAAGPSWA